MDNRQMIHLKTKEECRLGNETIEVWTVELPSKWAESVVRALKQRIPRFDAVDLQHCRRFAKPKALPAHVLGPRDYSKPMYSVSRAWDSTPQHVMQTPHTTLWDWSTLPTSTKGISRPQTLYLLTCPVKIVAKEELEEILLETPPFSSDATSWAFPLHLTKAKVPLLAPTSSAQATEWSEKYWPTYYRKTNPFGAHPAAIQTAENDLQRPTDNGMDIKDMMALAEKAAAEIEKMGWGIGTGCVIVERTDGKVEVAAVAGDARLKPLPVPEKPEPRQKPGGKKKRNSAANQANTGGCDGGNVMGHSLMRAIGMIGRKRLRCASRTVSAKSEKSQELLRSVGLAHDEAARDAFFLDLPMNETEKAHFDKDNIKPDGYLCLRLEVILTHEPCVMCSMAMVHSRVGRVVFKHRMPGTGGLTAEMTSNHTGPVGLGYGLCWRKELNWQFMCWEYVDPSERGSITEQADKAESTEGTVGPHISRATGDRATVSSTRSNRPAGRAALAAQEKVVGRIAQESLASGRGGEKDHNTPFNHRSQSTPTSKNIFDLLGDDGADLPSEDETPAAAPFVSRATNVRGSLSGVHV